MDKENIFKPRKPTAEEKKELIDHMVSLGYDREDEKSNVNNSYIAVFDRYISDTPGYVGKLMFVVWGFPSAYNVFIWEDEKITHVDQEA